VKRTLGILAVVATLGAVVYLGSRVWAQQQPYNGGTQAAPMQTHIALVNLAQVIKNYKKYQAFEDNLKQQSEYYQKQFNDKKSQLAAKQGQSQTNPPMQQAQAEQLADEIKNLQRDLQDMADKVKQRLAKQEFDELVLLYKEVTEAATVYAKANAIDLVMHYNDAIGPDAFSPALFQRKLANGACMPMYMDPRMDITDVVTGMLNQRLASSTPARPVNQ
jgi:Skp family chaperone for outer membrane proteins